MNEAQAIFLVAKIWASIGAFVAAVFLIFAIDRVDEDADGAYIFRPLLVPGVVLIWPLVLWRWFVLATGRDNWKLRYRPVREAHFWVSIIFGISIIAIMIAGLSLRQTWPSDFVPQKLSSMGGVLT